MQLAESLMVRGTEHGYLSPDDILEVFLEMVAEPGQVFCVFEVFKEMGIEVSDEGKDFEKPTKSTTRCSSRST